MKIKAAPARRCARAYALLMVLILTGASMLMMTGALDWGSQNAIMTDRFKQLKETEYAAEAATEKVLAQMTADFQNANAGMVFTNTANYQTNIPNPAEFPGWADYQFSDALGSSGRIYVQRTSASNGTNSSPLQSQYSGLSGFCDNYRILANVKRTNATSYSITSAVQQDIQLALIPIFQFAIFYNTDMEFAQTATIVVNGRAHGNGNIITGSLANETFNGDVTSVGYDMTIPGYMGLATSGGTLTFNGQQETNVASLSLPIGTNNTSAAIHQVIQIPPTNEPIASPMGQQRYYNKAELLVLVTDTNVTVGVKQDFGSSSNNIPWAQITNSGWITTNKSFIDQREANKTVQVTEIDVGKFTTWAATNAIVIGTLGAGTPPNIVYLADNRAPSATKMSAVRIVNGQTLPARGLTLATPNPLYTVGNFNAPAGDVGTSSTMGTLPSSIVCDAYTLLSANWSDAASSGSYTSRNPVNNTTVNTAIITGNVLSTGSSTSGYSGGVNNLPRLLENWSGNAYWLTGSLVCLYQSAIATNKFQMPGAYYTAPTRHLSFDTNFLDVTKMPPGCPAVKALIRGQWSTPPAGVTNYTKANSY